MNSKLEGWIVLATIHATERIIGRKIAAEERAHFKNLLAGTGKEIEITNGCGNKRWVGARWTRNGVLQFRWVLSPPAAQNGCLEEGKRWQDLCAETCEKIMRKLGRKGLPVEFLLCLAESDGRATSRERTVTLDRGGG